MGTGFCFSMRQMLCLDKPGATQNAHDRHVNQEVSYLLGRFESNEGVFILASNFEGNINSDFYRRFHSIVKFKSPEAN